jgi:capsular exopolysaccharide synthesis family protein
MDGSGAGVREAALGPAGRIAPPRYGMNLPTLTRDQFDLGEMFRMLRRRRGIIFGTIGVVTLATILLVLTLTPRYTAETAILLDTRKTQVIDLQAVMSSLNTEAAALRSEIDVLRSRELAGRVVDKLGLMGDPNFNDELKGRTGLAALIPDEVRDTVAGWLSAVGIGRDRTADMTEEQQRDFVRAKLIDKLLDNLVVANDNRSYTIKLVYTSVDPALSQRIVNTVADLYLVSQLEAKFEATRRANNWLSERVQDLKQQVVASEQAVQQWREANNLTAADAKGTTVSTQQLGELNTQLILASADRAQKESRLRQFQEQAKSGRVDVSAPEVANSPLIAQLRSQETEIIRREADLSARYGDKHPSIINVRAELRDVRRQIGSEISKIIGGLAQEAESARIRERSLQTQLGELQNRAAHTNSAEVKMRELEREAQANRVLYENFLGRFKETAETEDMQQADARVIARADMPLDPSFPNKKLFVALAFVGSALFGVLLAIIVERLDNGFRSADQIEQITGISGLGMVPAVPAAQRLSSTLEEFLIKKPSSSFAESVRSVRTALLYSHVDKPPRAVLITSAVPEEGKSSLAISLARSSAKAGQKVLLIDADMRRPRVHRILNGRNDATLADLFAGQKTAEEVLNVDEETGMHFICTRAGMPNPQDLLGSQHMRDFIRSVSQHYDLVVIDSPPVLAASDSVVLSRVVDATVFVVRWENTPRPVVLGALKQLQAVGGSIAGIVLTRVNVKKHARFGYGDTGYYYGKYKEYAT